MDEIALEQEVEREGLKMSQDNEIKNLIDAVER